MVGASVRSRASAFCTWTRGWRVEYGGIQSVSMFCFHGFFMFLPFFPAFLSIFSIQNGPSRSLGASKLPFWSAPPPATAWVLPLPSRGRPSASPRPTLAWPHSWSRGEFAAAKMSTNGSGPPKQSANLDIGLAISKHTVTLKCVGSCSVSNSNSR